MFNNMIEKVLLDTDIGTDVDDAAALAYLLSQPRCELLGITTVAGDSKKRAMLASILCKAANNDIPIYPGCSSPILVPQRDQIAKQASLLSKWNHDEDFPEGEAIEFLRRTIRKNPGEVTLLAIGPMTNIGLLFSVDPEIPKLLKRLVLMCGVFTNFLAGVGPLENNAVIDPHATAVVYQNQVSVHRSIGLDVTCRVTLDANKAREMFNHGLLIPVLDFAEIWFNTDNKVTFHDPLAAVTIFDESICTFKKGNVIVELQSERLKGFTYWMEDESNGINEVALDVNAKKFLDHYFSVFK